jgi:hypothetical protein
VICACFSGEGERVRLLKTVPEIVPSGGLYAFASIVCDCHQPRINTNEHKLMQIVAKY